MGDIIPLVSPQRRRLEAQTLQLFQFLFPLEHMERPPLQNKRVGVLRIAFQARKSFGTFEKRAPGLSCSKHDLRQPTGPRCVSKRGHSWPHFQAKAR